MQREWKEIENFDESFNRRTKALLDLLELHMGNDSYVDMLDVGCGLMFAKDYFAKKRGIEYYGVDYKKRAEDTLVCDLNKKEFPQRKFDLFLIAGCLEYVEDLEWFFEKIGDMCKKTVCLSYCLIELNPDIGVRQSNAWKNHLSENMIIDAMKKQGFLVSQKEIYNKKTMLFIFKKE